MVCIKNGGAAVVRVVLLVDIDTQFTKITSMTKMQIEKMSRDIRGHIQIDGVFSPNILGAPSQEQRLCVAIRYQSSDSPFSAHTTLLVATKWSTGV